MTGMNRYTGQALDEASHIRQSIADILTTPLGSRLMRRHYGSILFELIDQPMEGATLLRTYTGIMDAIARWETRVSLVSINRVVDTERPGRLTLSAELAHRRTGTTYTDTITLGE